MSRNPNTVSLVETALLTALAAILAIAGFYLPLLGYLLFIIAVPYIVIRVRHSQRYVVISAIASAILVTFLTFPTYGLYLALVGGLVGAVMGHHILRQRDSSTIIFYGALTATVALIVMFSLASVVSGVSLADMMTEIMDETLRLTENMGLPGMDDGFMAALEETVETIKMMVPSALILSGAIFAVINYAVAAAILKRIGTWVMPPRPFSRFSLPGNVLIGTTVILVLSYLVGQLNIVDSGVLFLNVLNLFIYLFLVQGLAVLFHLIERNRLGKGVKIALVAFVIITSMTVPVAVVGWLDSALDFRKIRRKS